MARELRQIWDSLPNKAWFAATIVAWTALFHWLGNPTLGYVASSSMFTWTWALWKHGSDTNSDDQMGMVVPFIVLGLLFYRRYELNAVTKKNWLPGLAIFVLAILIHIAGYLIQQTRVVMVGYLLGVYALMGVFWGWTWLRAVFFPYILFVFCIPFSVYLDSLTFKLRLVSATLSVGIAKTLFHLPIDRVGTMVFHPATAQAAAYQFDVAPACSGIRSAAVILMLTITFSFLFFNSWSRRAITVASSPLLAVAGNVVRLVFTFVVADKAGEAAGKSVETNTGFLTFLVAIGGVVLLGKIFPKEAPTELPPEPDVPPGKAPGGRLAWLGATSALGLCAASSLWLAHLKHSVRLGTPAVRLVNSPIFTETGVMARTNSVYLPLRVAGFDAQTEPMRDLEVGYLPGDTSYARMNYTARDRSFGAKVNVVLMGADRTSIHRPEYCLTGLGWDILKSGKRSVPIDNGTELEVSVFQMVHAAPPGQKGQISGVYVFWFVADGVRTCDAIQRQWALVRSMFAGGEIQRWAYISFFAPCTPGSEEETFGKLTKLIRQLQPEIEQGTLKPLANWPSPPRATCEQYPAFLAENRRYSLPSL